MIRVAIVEDDPVYQRQLRQYLERYEAERGQAFEILTFGSGQEIAYHYDASFDIILMDIEMGAVSGMEAAEIIRTMDQDVVIMFITNSPQYAIRGYAVEALDYVLKPIAYFAFAERLSRAIERMGKRQKPAPIHGDRRPERPVRKRPGQRYRGGLPDPGAGAADDRSVRQPAQGLCADSGGQPVCRDRAAPKRTAGHHQGGHPKSWLRRQKHCGHRGKVRRIGHSGGEGRSV